MEDSGSKKKGGMGWIIAYIVVFIAFIGIGFLVSVVMPKAITEERTISVDTLKSEVKEINELASLQYDYRDVVQYQKTNSTTVFKKKINTGKTGFIATFDGTIKAGIDLNDVDYDVDNPPEGSDESPSVTIAIPEAKVLSHEDSNPKTLFEEGISTSGIGKIRNAEIKEKKEEVQQEFIDDGKLEEAKEQAKTVIEDFIHSAYGEDVKVSFTDK